MVKRISINDSLNDFAKNVACIGYFDALHLGHLKLINETIEKAKKLGYRSMLICFEPDPTEIIFNKKQKHILSYKERIEKIRQSGIDDIVVFRFDEAFMNIDAISFIKNYLNSMNIAELICGFDFTFGYKGNGNTQLLKKYASFKINIIDEVKYHGKKISSTRIKEEINKGNLKLVNRLLGYDYYLLLKVIKSSQNGLKTLVEAILQDKSRIIPKNINEYTNIRYMNDIFYIECDEKIDINDDIILVFSDE